MTYEQKGITCRQCFIDNTYICQTKSKHHFFIFIYTGNVQTFTTPCATSYKLEVWGAEGSLYHGRIVSGEHLAGKGGYAKGYRYTEANNNLYICVGGQGRVSSGYTSNDNYNTGGYNGGGYGQYGGGGATHIATTNRGILKSYASYKSEVLIVAGGGGGYDGNAAGDGGGEKGGDSGGIAKGGTQTSGGGGGTPGSFGQGGSYYVGNDGCGSGGGGWYGGGSSVGSGGSGAGGSGYIGGVSNGTMQNGLRLNSGYCIITWQQIP